MNDVVDLFPPGAHADDGGDLVVGGCRLRDLAAEFGTPAYVVAEEGLGCDVAGAGELVHAVAAGVDPSLIYLHGNAKTDEDLERAIDAGVGTVVIDNLDDVARLE